MIHLTNGRRKADEAPMNPEPAPVEPTQSQTEPDADSSGSAQSPAADTSDDDALITAGRGGIRWAPVLAYGLVPALALLLAIGAGYLKWRDATVRDSQIAATDSVRAATESTVKMLSYRPDTVDKDLEAAGDRLTESFRDSYAALIHDVVIPGAKEKQVSAVATVPAAASVSADQTHAVVVVFVNQATTVGKEAPTDSASSVRVTLDNIDGRWLVSQFEPI